MREELEPIVGNWYRYAEEGGQTFRVIGIDEERDVIEVQYFDGDTEEIEGGAWDDLELEAAAPPEGEDEDEDDDLDYDESEDESDWDEDDDDEDDDEDDDDWEDDSDDY